jgi:hypothetical protein
MNKPTKVQITVDFEEVPKRAVLIIRENVLREVAFVANVLQQVVGRTEPLPVEDISFSVDQARRCLYNADLYLQDAQDMVNGFVTHKAQAAVAALEATQAQGDDVTLVKGPSKRNKDDESDTEKEPSESKK